MLGSASERLSAPLRTGPASTRLVLLALALLAAVWLVGALIGAGSPSAAFAPDTAWFDLLQGVRSTPLTRLAEALNLVGGGWTSVRVTLVVIAVVTACRGWRAGLFVEVCSSLSAIDVQAMKSVAGRLRPPHELVAASGGSFPSGHTSNAAVLVVACALVLGRRWCWYPAVAYVLVMALSRTYLNVHWASDTIAGGVEGTAIALAVWFVIPPRRDAEAAEPGALGAPRADAVRTGSAGRGPDAPFVGEDRRANLPTA